MKKKLNTRRGLTLTELLVSLALMAILAAGVTTGLSAAAAAEKDSVALSESSLLLDSVMKAVIGELRYATGVKTASAPIPDPPGYTVAYSSPVQYLSHTYGMDTRFYVLENAEGFSRIYVSTRDGSYALMGEGAYSDMGAGIKSIGYDAGTGCFTVVLTITLPDGHTTEYPPLQVYPILRK